MPGDTAQGLREQSAQFFNHPLFVGIVVALMVGFITSGVSWYVASVAFREMVDIRLQQIERAADKEANRHERKLSESVDRLSTVIQGNTEALTEIDTRLRSVELDVRALQAMIELPPGRQGWYRRDSEPGGR